ncbi:MAG: ankyrin repeat domain-containing protein [Candidatus Omnitrophota bacterium]
MGANVTKHRSADKLVHAIAFGATAERVRAIIAECPVDVNAHDRRYRYTPLTAACRRYDHDPAAVRRTEAVVAELVSAGAKPDVVDGMGDVPLNLAAYDDRVSLVRLLLARGANPNTRSANGYTALHYAAASASLSVRDLLLAKADPRLRANDGRTPRRVAERVQEGAHSLMLRDANLVVVMLRNATRGKREKNTVFIP